MRLLKSGSRFLKMQSDIYKQPVLLYDVLQTKAIKNHLSDNINLI